MPKTLIIAEKSSVATDIARVLGKLTKTGNHFENDKYIVASAIGHLVELFMPEDIDEKLRFWRLGSLPIVPEQFNLKPIAKTKARFQELKKLMSRRDVERIVNACDAGREGELIFTYVYELAKCRKPIQRLWLQSMTIGSIRDAFGKLRAQEEMTDLQDAARCRSQADWLVGINGTRAVTARMFGRRAKGNVASVGRVQTPTLALVLEREREIRRFKPRTYYRINGHFEIERGHYGGLYQRLDFTKRTDEHDRVDRIWDRDEAERIVRLARERERALIEDKNRRSTQISPRLYDLTTLQRESNSRFKMSARRSLQLAQTLYEKYKLITYPRTDSRALPNDYIATCRDILRSMDGDLSDSAKKVLDRGWLKPNRRIFNNAQVTDHFAIIPTEQQKTSKVSADEAKIYAMICRRFVAAFFPQAEYDVTVRTSMLGEHAFKTEGRVLVEPGWLEVYGKQANMKENLPAVTARDGTPPQARVLKLELLEETTKPPPRYTEATLLSAMEGAGKLVEEEELADAMKGKGLGTPATRAQTIEQLINQKYIERKKQELIPTAKADSLIDFLKATDIDILTSPTLTGEWEYRLHQIEEGRLSRDEFMGGITDMTNRIVDRIRKFEETQSQAEKTSIISPSDGQPMLSMLRAYQSQDGKITIYKNVSHHRVSMRDLSELLTKNEIGPFDDFLSKTGRPFTARLRLGEGYKVAFLFENKPRQNGGAESSDEQPEDIANLIHIGKCPKCGERVLEGNKSFACEHAFAGRNGCDFRISRTMLGKQISSTQVCKLLEDGKTDLIEQFLSRRTKKYFSASLFLKANGGIGFEFPARAAKKKSTVKDS